MPAFFSLNLNPSVTRDNIAIKHSDVNISIQYQVTKDFYSQPVALINVNAVGINLRGFDLTGFNNIALSCDATATKRIDETLEAEVDVISDGGALRTTSSNQFAISNLAFLGGRLIDNIVNARYSNVGYVTEGYAQDEPAAKTFATLRAESDITVLLSVNVVSTLSVDTTVSYSPTINLAAEANLSCSVTGVQLIQMSAFGNSQVAIDYIRYRDNDSILDNQFQLSVDADFTADGIQLVVSEATITATVAKILGGIVVGDLPAAFTLVCVGDDLILEETQVFVEVQSTLYAFPGNRHFGSATLTANSGVVNVYTIEHIEEYVYKIPAEGWEYKIEAESRYYEINSETRVRKISGESRVKKIAAESRIHIIT